jgi:hypothetical protein
MAGDAVSTAVKNAATSPASDESDTARTAAATATTAITPKTRAMMRSTSSSPISRS